MSSASSSSSRSSSSSASELPKPSSPGHVLQEHHRQLNASVQDSEDSDSDHGSSWSDDDSDRASHRRCDILHLQGNGGNTGAERANVGDICERQRSKTRRRVDSTNASSGSNDQHDGNSSRANKDAQNKSGNNSMSTENSDTEHNISNHTHVEGGNRAVRCRQMLLGSATVSLLSEAAAHWFEPSQALRLRRCRRAFTALADACESMREEKGTERARELEEQCRLLKSQVAMLTSIQVSGESL
jgi:hypothetical protein